MSLGVLGKRPCPPNLPVINVPKGCLLTLTSTLQILWTGNGVERAPKHLMLSSAQIKIRQGFWAALISSSLCSEPPEHHSQCWMKNRASASHEVWGAELFLAWFSQRADHVGLLSAASLLVCSRSSTEPLPPPLALSLPLHWLRIHQRINRPSLRHQGDRSLWIRIPFLRYFPHVFLNTHIDVCIQHLFQLPF